jgi:hypothetical protein
MGSAVNVLFGSRTHPKGKLAVQSRRNKLASPICPIIRDEKNHGRAEIVFSGFAPN